MTTKAIYPSRAEARGNVESGLRDHAFLVTRTHSQWSRTGLTLNVDDRLIIILDGGANSATINLTALSDPFTIDELVAAINAAFLGVGVVAFALDGGYLLLRSFREGIGSAVDISTSDADVLSGDPPGFEWEATSATARKIEDTPEHVGIEDNPLGTRLLGQGERFTKEHANRAAIALFSNQDVIQGYLNREYAVPVTSLLSALSGGDTRSIYQLSFGVYLRVTISSGVPRVGEELEGDTSGTTGNIANITPADTAGQYWLSIPTASDAFTAAEDFTCATSGATGTLVEIVEDTRIKAIKMPSKTFVGGIAYFGGSLPTAAKLESLFQLTNLDVSGVPNGLVRNTFSDAPANPSETQRRTRVKNICAGTPTGPYVVSNEYNQLGIVRQTTTAVNSWTKNKVYPASISAAVEVGDILEVTGSVDGAVNLNNGNYCIVEIGADHYVVGPSLPARTASGVPEETLADPEIFENANTASVNIRVLSPSYYLDQRNDNTGTNRSCWLFLEEPAYFTSASTITYYKVTTLPDDHVGRPQTESPSARFARGLAEDVDTKLANLDTNSFHSGSMDPERHRIHNSLTGLSKRLATVDTDLFLPETDVLEEQFSPIRAVLARYTTDPARDGNIQRGQLSTVAIVNETKAASTIGPVYNTHQRVFDTYIQEFSYTPTASGHPPEGTTLTGTTSGATILSIYSQEVDRNAFLGEILSGYPVQGEEFTWNAGADNILAIGNFAFVGLVMSLPNVTSGQTGSISQNGTVVSLGGSGLPDYFSNIKAGDTFWATSGPLAAANFRARIQSFDSGARTITLETTQPYASATAFNWRVTPGFGHHVVISGTDASVTKGTNIIHINTVSLSEPNPYSHGIGPGDLIKATSGADGTVTHKVIKSIYPRPGSSAGNFWIVEVEDSDGTLLDASSVAWEIISTHSRISGVVRESYDSYFKTSGGIAYDSVEGSELWLLNGPGYIKFPVPFYDGVSAHGGPASVVVSGWGASGLTGKAMTVELYRGTTLLDSMTLTFTTDPTLPGALQTELETLIAGTGKDWLAAEFVTGDEASFVFRTTCLDAYTPATIGGYGAVGPGISLHVYGDAWDVLTSGVTPEYGNTSDVVEMAGVDEYAQHIIPTTDYGWDFRWQGTLSTLVRNSEIGRHEEGGAIFTAMDSNSPLVNSGDHSRQLNQELFAGPGASQTPAISVTSPFQSHRTTDHRAISIADTEESGFLTFDGRLGSRSHRPVMRNGDGPVRGTDAFRSYGLRPPEIHSGPITFSRSSNDAESWHGHTLGLIVGHGKTLQRVLVDFTATEVSVETIITAINTALTAASVNGWLECTFDQQHTGFVIRFKRTTSGPHYHERSFLAIDPYSTTLGEPFRLDPNSAERYRELYLHDLPATFSGHTRGMMKASGRTSIAESRGAAGGLVEDVAGGRRLIAPRHRDGTVGNTAGNPPFEAVIWEEVVGSVQHLFGRKMTSLTSQDEAFPQPESLIWMGGSRGAGKLMLYQFADSTDFELGESVSWNDENVVPGGIDAQSSAQISFVEIANASKGFKSKTKEAQDIRVQLVEISGHANTGVSDTLSFNSGGTQIVGATSGAIAYYNPIIIRLDNIQNEPAWSVGDELNFENGVEAYFGERFTINSDVFYVIIWSDHNWQSNVGTDPTAPLTVFDLFRNVTSTDHGTFSAVLMEVYALDSNILDGGNVRPVVALSNKSFNPYDGHLNKPSVNSFGDFQVPQYGDYLFGDRLPKQDHSWYGTVEQYLYGTESGVTPNFPVIAETSGAEKRVVVFGSTGGEWEVKQIFGPPLKVGDTIATAGGFQLATLTQIDAVDSPMYGVQMAEQGRAFTTEVLADAGHAIEAMDASPTSFSFPAQTGGLETAITLNKYISGVSTKAALTHFRNLGPETKGIAFRTPNTTPAESEYEFYGTTFHVPTPGGYVWVEGFGAYVYHALPPDNSYDRPPLVVSLHLVGGQSKGGVWDVWESLDNDGYVHRLEVKNTDDKVIRVDSAGRGSIYDEEANQIPPWAIGNVQVVRESQTWPISRWGHFKPFPLWMFNEHTVELYIEPIGSGSAPDNNPEPGFSLISSDGAGGTSTDAPAPTVSSSLAYVEKYNTDTEDTGNMYRFIVYNGPSMNNRDNQGYPELVAGGAKTFPPFSQGYPGAEQLYREGQIVRWSSGSGYGIGRVRHIVTYPHGANLRIMVHLNHGQENSITYRDSVAGVFVRFRSDRLDLSRL